MRIKSDINSIKPYLPGKVTLIADTLDDLWQLYNIIQKGNLLQIKVSRKVAAATQSNDCKKKANSKKKTFMVTIKIKTIDYDSQGDEIRINGKNVYENEYISVGQFQSASIRTSVQFSIIKKNWEPFHIDALHTATNPSLTADLAVILMEEGLCNLYLISNHMILNKAKIELSIPKKRKGPSQHDNSLEKFFGYIVDAIRKSINFSIVKCVVVGSPGYTKDQFSVFLNDKISNFNNNSTLVSNSFDSNISNNKNKFIYTHSSSGNRSALDELLSKKDVLSKIKDTKASEEIVLINKFQEVLGKNYQKIAFGKKAIEIAIEYKAIDFILLTDNYLRKMNANQRKLIQEKLDIAEKDGAYIRRLSSMLHTGEKVDNMGGIIAVLKFEVKEIDDVEDCEDNIEDLNDNEEDTADVESELNEYMTNVSFNNSEENSLDYKDN